MIKKGTLLRKKPYTISATGVEGMKVVINQLSNFKPGDMVYEIGMPDGSLLLVPEEIYKKAVDET